MIDVIVTSTCRKQFEATYASFVKNVKYRGGFRFIIHVDVFEKNKRYLPKLLEFLRHNRIDDVKINTGKHSFANAVNYLHGRLESEYYFNLEDDWIFLRQIDLDSVMQVMKNNENIHNIRFSKERIKKPDLIAKKRLAKSNELYLLTGDQVSLGGTDLIESTLWSLNPHIARTLIAKQFPHIPEGTNPENFLFKKYNSKFTVSGLYIYGKYGDPPYVKDIGRHCFLVKKIKTISEILRNPSLIKKQDRMKKMERYLGGQFES